MGTHLTIPKEAQAHYPPKGATSVLLVVPRYTRQALPPHGVRYLAAALSSPEVLHRVAAQSRLDAVRSCEPPTLHVRILDLSVAPPDFDLERFLDRYSPSVLGVTANAHSIGAAFTIAQAAERANGARKALKVVGGYLPSAAPAFALRRGFGVAALGFGEETLAELVLARHVLGPREILRLLPQIPGIAYKASGLIHINGRREASIPLDDLPFPLNADPLQIFGNYPELAGLKQGFVVGSRGCAFRCKYCSGPAVTMGKVRSRSAGNILAEVQQLYNLGLRTILFDEEDFLLRPNGELTALLDGLRALKQRDPTFGWAMETRGDRLTEDSIRLMAGAGLKTMAFGVETLDEPLARRIKNDPNLSIARVHAATRAGQAAGISVYYNLMLGSPGYGWKEVLATALALKDQPPDLAMTTTYKHYPGSPFYAEGSPAARSQVEAWQERAADPNGNYPVLDTDEMTAAEMNSAGEELELLLFCIKQTQACAPNREPWKLATKTILDAFRINAMYDLFLSSGSKKQSRACQLRSLSADAKQFFAKRASLSKGFSYQQMARKPVICQKLTDYMAVLLSLESPEETVTALDKFLQTVTVEGGFSLASLSIQQMQRFVMLVVALVYSPIHLTGRTFSRIVIEDERAVLAAAMQISNHAGQATLATALAPFLAGNTNRLSAFGFVFELDQASSVLKISAAG